MGHQCLRLLGRSAVPIAVLSLAAAPVAAQTTAQKATTANVAKIAKTSWGDPDLQGVWDRHTITPLERPSKLEGKAVLSNEEAAELEEQSAENSNVDRGRQVGTEGDVGRAYNEFWWDHARTVIGDKRTSQIIDPAEGKIPAVTADAQARLASNQAERDRRPLRGTGGFEGGRGADSYTDRSLWERCITQGLPKLGSNAYNANLQIVQAPGYVVLLDEMIHEARIVPLDGRPHLHASVRQWLGDSRGHWEGNTLVVDTTNFTDNTNFRGSTSGLHMIERITRLDAKTLDYAVTFEDPATWTKPWTVDLPMPKTNGEIYEYACHEGNYGMFGILSGARAQEKDVADAAKKGSR